MPQAIWKQLRKRVLQDESGEVYERWEAIPIDSLLWSTLPEDILKTITDWLVTGYKEYRPGYQLKTFSLVCRDWHRRFAPYLRQSFCPKRRIQCVALISRLRDMDSVYCHAHKVTLRYVKNATPNIVRELSRLLPQVAELNLSGVDWNKSCCAHPSWSKIFAGAWVGFRNTTELVLSFCTFHSCADLIHVLAILPALSKVHLEAITWTCTTSAAPSRVYNRLRALNSERMEIWPLSRLWMLPQPHLLDQNLSYPGYSRHDAQVLAQIMQPLSEAIYRDLLRTRLRPSIYPRTCEFDPFD